MKPLIPLFAATLLGAALFVPRSEIAGNASEPRVEYPIKLRKSIKADDGILRCVAISPDGKYHSRSFLTQVPGPLDPPST